MINREDELAKEKDRYRNTIYTISDVKKYYKPSRIFKEFKAVIDKFKSLIVINENGCHNFLRITEDGYGRYYVSRTRMPAHRLNYILEKGRIKNGYVIDHKCRNRACVNPKHLREVTAKDNVLKNSIGIAAINMRKTVCLRGHKLSGKNVRIIKAGRRQCLKCVMITRQNKIQLQNLKSVQNDKDPKD